MKRLYLAAAIALMVGTVGAQTPPPAQNDLAHAGAFFQNDVPMEDLGKILAMEAFQKVEVTLVHFETGEGRGRMGVPPAVVKDLQQGKSEQFDKAFVPALKKRLGVEEGEQNPPLYSPGTKVKGTIPDLANLAVKAGVIVVIGSENVVESPPKDRSMASGIYEREAAGGCRTLSDPACTSPLKPLIR